ncbi:hypothetical protein [Bacteroides intestinalis]|uniref:Uncharacterized protein n=1 Tax=Bacteroides intestinalis TaxID=329854 RepID=A0A415N858_9BACE|nr:hypothetical protein [Bacteroides intestinalis]RHL92154.1 hypothetical protein DWZ95_12705 [Bacteroides intestinalis]
MAIHANDTINKMFFIYLQLSITKEKEIILADNVAYTEPMPQEKAKAFLAISILSTHNLPNKHRTTYPKATK